MTQEQRADLEACREFFDSRMDTLFGPGHDIGMAAHASLVITQVERALLPAAHPADGHGYAGEFTAAEFYERAFDHEKAARNGLSAGPNVSYVRTFQACAHALRMAAPLLPKAAS